MPSNLSPDFTVARARLAGASQARARRSQAELASLRRHLLLVAARDQLASSLPRDLNEDELELVLGATPQVGDHRAH